MKPARVAGACLVVAVALSAVCAAGASAEAPEFGQCLKKAEAGGVGYVDSKCTKEGEEAKAKYEWLPGAVAGKNRFTMKGTTLTWATKAGRTMTCTSQKGEGEYSLTNSKQLDNVVFELAGCTTAGLKCTTAGRSEGELVFNQLAGEVGFENAATKKTALKLYPAASEKSKFIVFKCVGLESAWRGKGEDPAAGFLVNIKNDKMTATETLKYKASKGVQQPVKWEGLPSETFMESSFEKLPFEQAGWTETIIVSNDEAMKYELSLFA
jgi:hypothetical protein